LLAECDSLRAPRGQRFLYVLYPCARCRAGTWLESGPERAKRWVMGPFITH
jgi:hypothetical protein